MPTEHLILIGAGGHARVVFDAAMASGAWRTIEVRDDVAVPSGTAFDGRPVSAPALPPAVAADASAHVAIGHNATRHALVESLRARNVALAIVLHPRACVSSRAQIALGAFVAAQAVVGPMARVGHGSIINHAAIIDHDCEIGDWCHVAPGAILGGGVIVGIGALIGAGAVLLPGVRVGDGATVGAGAVVTKTVAAESVVAGVPARELREE
jgi:sugar O-acyltransferase (sialic acid O-acetyltransferase NeuD family)